MALDRDAFSEVFMIPLSTAVSSGFTFSTNWHGFELNRGLISGEIDDSLPASIRRAELRAFTVQHRRLTQRPQLQQDRQDHVHDIGR